MLLRCVTALLLLCSPPVFSLPAPAEGRYRQPRIRTVYEFPKPSWLESIAVQRNGSILVTEMTQPRLWQIDPLSRNKEPWLVTSVPGYHGLLGITELEEDVFAFVAGNFSLTQHGSIPGTYALWKVDMRSGPNPSTKVQKIIDIPQASFLNGIAYLPKPANSLLIADSTFGLVYRHNLTSGKTDVAIESPLMKKCSPEVLEGINGLRVHGDEIYFTNGYCGTFCKLPINSDGSARNNDNGTIIARTSSSRYIFDDMAIGSDGSTYLATGTENLVTRVAPNGVADVFAGDLNSSAIVEPTSMAFGRTKADFNVLYVVTGGGLGGKLNGTTLLGGQLVAIPL